MDHRYYVKIKSRKWQLNQRILLPLSIGSAPTNHIVVNSDMAAPVARLVDVDDGRLVYFDPVKSEFTNERLFAAYGFSVQGPYPASVLFKGRLKRFFQEMLCLERNTFQRFPLKVQHALGGFAPQHVRLLAWAFCLLSFTSFMVSRLLKDSEVLKDRSREVLQVAYASYYPKNLGAAGSFRDFKRGSTVAYDIPPESRGKAHVLSFGFKDNDIQNELTIKVGQQTVYVSELDKACKQPFCPQQVIIPATLTQAPRLVVFFQHNFPASDYVLNQVLLERTSPLRPEEVKTVERWLASAQRFFDERFVAHTNILAAKDDVERVLAFLRPKEGVDDYRARASSLLAEIDACIEVKVRDLWFAAQQNTQLGKYAEAKASLVALKVFVSTPSDPRFAQISKMTRQVEELLK